jgi:hypothetical protein
VEWVAPADNPKENYKSGGFATAALDVMLNMTNTIAGYRPDRKWHTSAFLRMGVITQFSEGSGSPLMGVGVEETYRLNDRLSLFGSAAYQVSTSEGLGVSGTGMEVAAGSNGFFDIDFGIRCEIGGRTKWRKEPGGSGTRVGTVPAGAIIDSSSGTVPSESCWGQEPSNARSAEQMFQSHVSGSPLRHNWPRFAVNTVASVAVAYVGKTVLKAVVNEERPDHSDNKSFPSGHASMAFAAARSIDKEFRKDSPWISVAGYAAATAVGVERVVNDHHHWYDVIAGAALGFGSAELTWWVSDKLFPNRNVAVGFAGNAIDVKVGL